MPQVKEPKYDEDGILIENYIRSETQFETMLEVLRLKASWPGEEYDGHRARLKAALSDPIALMNEMNAYVAICKAINCGLFFKQTEKDAIRYLKTLEANKS